MTVYSKPAMDLKVQKAIAAERERCAEIAEAPIADLEDQHRNWRESFGSSAAQPYDDEISVRKQIAASIRTV